MQKISNRVSRVICLIIGLLMQTILHAEQEDSLTIAFTFSMPPYLSEDLHSGIELDIIKAALEVADSKMLVIDNVHYLRAIELTKAGQVDLIASNKSNQIYSQQIPGIYTSDTTINYVDCAISLKQRDFKLDNMDDYKDKRIWAFKSANLSLGEAFHKMALSNPNYTENVDQKKQIDMLAMDRIDVAISDRNIFMHRLKASDRYADLQFDYHTIGSPTARAVRSTNKALIDKLNEGLAEIRLNGSYEKILADYQSSYSANCL